MTELEIRYSHLERLVDELNRVVFEQGKSIDALRAELLRMRTHMEQSDEGPPKDEKPPHY
ncbi:MAG TPA: SlyX family protein [Polyangiaceae bacterium]|nr:SlyX family protein [Polyangiaceae bacterium]